LGDVARVVSNEILTIIWDDKRGNSKGIVMADDAERMRKAIVEAQRDSVGGSVPHEQAAPAAGLPNAKEKTIRDQESRDRIERELLRDLARLEGPSLGQSFEESREGNLGELPAPSTDKTTPAAGRTPTGRPR
jgi:hypothetical protein